MENQSAEFEQPARALDRAYDSYINEVGPEAVAAQFGMPVESVHQRKLRPEIAFFLFDRQEDLHKNALEMAGGIRSIHPDAAPAASQRGALPGLPRMIPMTQGKGRDWINPAPRKVTDDGTHNASQM